jgi:geranylgeranyl diphosphate synthase type I
MLESIEDDLQLSIRSLKEAPYQEMSEMIEYHLGWYEASPASRGKRFRPLLTLLCCKAAGGDWRSALPAASCIELIHNFSLIHDDIQDESDLRRGHPTVWKRWGVAQAINTGDAVFVLARLACQRLIENGIPPATSLQALAVIDQECLNLTRGQFLDLDFEQRESVSESEYTEMISGKTCALLRGSAQGGAIITGASPRSIEHYRSFAHHLGMAFQIIDDILGIWGAEELTGKSNEDDLRARKKTLPVIYGLDHSPKFSQIWSQQRSSPGDIEGMREALEDAGADRHARQMADKATSLALRSLKSASPEKAAASELEDLATRLLARKR